MQKRPKRRKYFTFMVIPHDADGRTFNLRIPAVAVYLTVALALFSLAVVGSSVVYSMLLTRRLVNYSNTMARNREQQQVIGIFSRKTRQVHQAISELIRKDNELRKLLGLKHWKSRINLSLAINPHEKDAEISKQLEMADLKLAEKRQSFDELKKWVSTVRKRYAATPSRWPIYGRIVSRFGYRVYPWRGFHTGLDISGRYGSPIRSTADGVVSYVGWRQGYGRSVIIDHGHGVTTLYAHSSRYAVKTDQKVRKGQVICYVGNTGYTTGPHLHYEVRKWGRPINPVTYLNLNILTASRIWRE
ncbi:M23 family metallopeptidase [Candidatus Margulisiibacteriota bacterium]